MQLVHECSAGLELHGIENQAKDLVEWYREQGTAGRHAGHPAALPLGRPRFRAPARRSPQPTPQLPTDPAAAWAPAYFTWFIAPPAQISGPAVTPRCADLFSNPVNLGAS